MTGKSVLLEKIAKKPQSFGQIDKKNSVCHLEIVRFFVYNEA